MKNKLIAYALDFTSFLLEKDVEPRMVILFGSAVTGEFDEESDIDIFVDISENQEKIIRGLLNIYNKTSGEQWRLKGVSNPISLKIGNLEKWPDLRRSIQSYGILLYGKYTEAPENMRSYLLFRLNFAGLSRAEKISIWRGLYGYRQKVGKKKYEKKSIIQILGGKKVERGIVLIPSEKAYEFKQFLKKKNISFSVNEIWSDNL